MTNRNIAIANFAPKEVFNSDWPRFVGFKNRAEPEQRSGLFGLVDSSVRMHAFFENTTIKEILAEKLKYSRQIRITAEPAALVELDTNKYNIVMPARFDFDTTVKWLTPYEFTDSAGKEWDVYVLITGDDIHISSIAGSHVSAEGYWAMGIWRPRPDEGAVWTDVQRIEQLTINHVVEQGYLAHTSITMFEDDPDYGKYRVVDVTAVVPTYSV